MLSLFAKFQAHIGYNFTLLDIGGGFPGAPDAAITFEEVSYEAQITIMRSFIYT